ncbi:MAG: KEOPS complex subunit Cgi121 [Sulfolobales archaeon]
MVVRTSSEIKGLLGKLCEDLSKIDLSVYEVGSEVALKLIEDIDRLQVNGCITQVLPSTLVISDKQLLLASLQTFKAIGEGKNLSRKPYIEFLLRLFSNRQISEIINVLRSINSDSYLLVRVCKGPKKIVSSSQLIGTSIEPSELLKRFSIEALEQIVKVYGISKEVNLDVNKVHSLILTKISLFQHVL